MKILLLGATGRTGKHLLESALDEGYTVHCLVRNPEKIRRAHARIRVFTGSPCQTSDLQKAMQGCEAILSVLNVSRTSDFPWARLRTPHTFLSTVMRKVVQQAQKQNIQRVVVCSAWGVADTKQDIPWWFRALIRYSNIGTAYADHERQEKILRESGLSWTVVRPVGLTNSKKREHIIESYGNTPRPRLTIARKSVARFMVKSIGEDRLIGRSPVLSGKPYA